MAINVDPFSICFLPENTSFTKTNFEEPSVLDYARFHGLCRNYLLEPLMRRDEYPFTQIDLATDLKDPSGSVTLESLLEEFPVTERLILSKDEAAYVKFVLEIPECPDTVEQHHCSTMWNRNLKLELPLLKSDPDVDVDEFGRGAWSLNSSDCKIHFETTKQDSDEGLGFSASTLDIPRQVQHMVSSEKLEISQNSVSLLQSVIQYNTCSEGKACCFVLNTKISALEPVTPPLFPLSPRFEQSISPPSAGNLVLASDNSNSTTAEARALEASLMSNDQILPIQTHSDADLSKLDHMRFEEMELGDIYSPLRSIADPPPYTPRKRKREYKVEVPLTPLAAREQQDETTKRTLLSDMIRENFREISPTEEPSVDVTEPVNSFEALLNNHIMPIAMQVDCQVEQEQLHEASTTKRVEVPAMDFIAPIPPWKEYNLDSVLEHRHGKTELEAQSRLISKVKREELQHVQVWHGIAKLDRILQWAPFSMSSESCAIREDLFEEEALSIVLGNVKATDVVEIPSLLQKPPGLRILDPSDDDDKELKRISTVAENENIISIARKRKLELVEQDHAHIRTEPKPIVQSQLYQTESPLLREGPSLRSHQASRAASSTSMLNDLFSTSSALHHFMAVHGKAVISAGPVLDSFDTAPIEASQRIEAQFPIQSKVAKITNDVSFVQPAALATSHSVLPESFIISSALLKQRSFMKYMRVFNPHAELIERDYVSHISPADEADLIFSPAVGVIFTSLQKIKQKPLPGQKGVQSIRQRISLLSERYENIILLVTEGRLPKNGSLQQLSFDEPEAEANCLDFRDSEALCSLSAFCAVLEAHVSVIFVPGGEEDLAHWTVTGMHCFGSPESEQLRPRPLQDETLWELFLRRLGMNPYAAQQMLSSLRLPTTVSCKLAGLPALLHLTASERMNYFSSVMGGARILERHSKILDREWPSALNEYNVTT